MSKQVSTEVNTGRPIDVIKAGLEQMPLERSLPAHISVDKFRNAVLTALNLNPDLLEADRQSLYLASMRAAADGCVPDGREGAFVVYNSKVKRAGQEIWVKSVQWMIMEQGIKKRMRNSGDIASIVTHAVYKNDVFEFSLGDEESIVHKPTLDMDPGPVIAAYAIIKLKDGTIIREVMPRRDIDRARAMSRSKDGPAWTNWYDQMARVKVLRRASKSCPMDSETATFLHKLDEDDRQDSIEIVDVHDASSGATVAGPALAAPSVRSKLDQFEDDMGGSTVVQEQPAKQPRKPRAAKAADSTAISPEPTDVEAVIEHEAAPMSLRASVLPADVDSFAAGDVDDGGDERAPANDIPSLEDDLATMIAGIEQTSGRTELGEFWRSSAAQNCLTRISESPEMIAKVQAAFTAKHRSLPTVSS